MEMVTTTYITHLKSLVESGEVSQERIDDGCRRILAIKFRMGLFEHPYVESGLAEKVQFNSQHQDLARQIAGESLVLLKNEAGLLPLPKTGRKIAMMGPLVNQRKAILGSWTLDGLLSETQTIAEAMQLAAPEVVHTGISDVLTDEMLVAAMQADLTIYFAGESEQRSGENHNVATIDLPHGQDEVIEAIAALGKPLVVVVLAGRPLNLTRVARCANAILYAWHPGSLGAAAIADTLFGDSTPSGKLPASFPRSTGQIPVHYNFKSTGRSFNAVGRHTTKSYEFLDRYNDQVASPLYPFGYGLSYTTFEYSDVQVERHEIIVNEGVIVSALVTNTGKRAGVEIAQCYVQDCVSSTTRPVRELKGFFRVSLQPGESRRVSFSLGTDELSFYGADGKRRVEAGAFKVWVGGDCRADLEASFQVLS